MLVPVRIPVSIYKKVVNGTPFLLAVGVCRNCIHILYMNIYIRKVVKRKVFLWDG